MQQTYAYVRGRHHALARLGCAKYAGLSAQTLEAISHGAPAHAVEDWSVSMVPQKAEAVVGKWDRNKFVDNLEQMAEARAQGRQATDAMNQEFTTPFSQESMAPPNIDPLGKTHAHAKLEPEGTRNLRTPQPAPAPAAPQATAPQAAAPPAAVPQPPQPAKPPTNYTPALLAGTAGTALGIGGAEAYDHSGSN